MSDKIKVMLVDDHAVVRAGYQMLLKNSPEIEVIAEADSGKEAYRLHFVDVAKKKQWRADNPTPRKPIWKKDKIVGYKRKHRSAVVGRSQRTFLLELFKKSREEV